MTSQSWNMRSARLTNARSEGAAGMPFRTLGWYQMRGTQKSCNARERAAAPMMTYRIVKSSRLNGCCTTVIEANNVGNMPETTLREESAAVRPLAAP
eukprot:5206673-Prymnesium_polylepis.2